MVLASVVGIVQGISQALEKRLVYIHSALHFAQQPVPKEPESCSSLPKSCSAHLRNATECFWQQLLSRFEGVDWVEELRLVSTAILITSFV